jgi:cytochrome c
LQNHFNVTSFPEKWLGCQIEIIAEMLLNLRLVRLYIFLLLTASLLFQSCAKREPRVLVFSRTKGWKHTSIPFGMAAIQKLGNENNFLVDTTRDATPFNEDDLKQYHAVIFLNTTGNVLNPEQQTAFERYIQAGGGFVGIHSAAATEYEWSWYNKLIGAHFANHPNHPNVRRGTVLIADTTHTSTQHLPLRWERDEEWYSFRSFFSDLKVLAYLDENSYEGGTNGSHHPIAWHHEYDGGRAFYTAVGHADESFSDSLVVKHILGGIQYAMGNGELDYSKAYAVVKPEENRFVKTVLVNDLDNPMELDVTPDGVMLFSELRTGKLTAYNTTTGETKLSHKFNVCTTGGTGLIGVTVDPDFSSNRFVYVYYAPPTDKEPIIFNLSRFEMHKDYSLNIFSEKILLKVPVQNNSGAHHGGSLAWDKDGNLYLSTGDSSSPFPSNGYSPLDERPGAEYFSLDAQRGASNTNDFKGKILRIHPEKDGTYTIPEGNLFPKGTDKAKPEIFAMGCRNPYRIAVHPKTSTVYWGEIGPDAGEDGEQGPRGYDEFNQAKKAGNFGWPYFVGNNFAYPDWDFASNKAGPFSDPAAPVNHSPNNTGLTKLPPAIPAMIWYPYAASKEFPELGDGGRSAMAGSFYSYNESSESDKKFPSYYDDALFVFDWMRNWVMVLRFDTNENYQRSEPFMPVLGDFRRPIDLTFGKDGVMYMLEYGSVYGADNEDARLVKIEYNNGNRAPVVTASLADSAAWAELNKRVFLTSEQVGLPARKEAVGKAPLRVKFSSKGTVDPDDDEALTYEWTFDGQNRSTDANPTFVYRAPGNYSAILKVTDKAGSVDSDTVKVIVGNELPQVEIESAGNKSFFWPGKPFVYTVHVKDAEDVSINASKISVGMEYSVPASMLPEGYSLMTSSDCKACHTIDKTSVGPSYQAIAARYKNNPTAIDQLAKKVIAGGGGNWSDVHVMSAHPQLSMESAQEIVEYILSINDFNPEKSVLPSSGRVNFTKDVDGTRVGIYTINATYTDNGTDVQRPLKSSEVITLRNARVKTLYADKFVGFSRFRNNLSGARHKSYFFLKNIDMTGIKKFVYEYSSKDKAGEIEVRIDSYAGPVISRIPYPPTGDWGNMVKLNAVLEKPVTGRHDLYFILIKRDKPDKDIIDLEAINFE